MSTTITFRRGTAAPTQGAGLTLGEPAFDTTNRNLYVGLGSGVTAAWVGARISGLSTDIAAGLTNWIVNAKAIADYVTATAVTPSNVVTSFNGLTGAVGGVCAAQANTFTALQTFNSGITASAVYVSTGSTFAGLVTFTGGLSAAGTVTLASPNLTGTPTATTAAVGTNTTQIATTAFVQAEIVADTVTSVNGATGAITNVARTNLANTFTALQTFSAGISAAGGITFNDTISGVTATFSRLVTGNAGFSGALTGTATNASALGGTAAASWAQLAAANTFTALQTFNTGISAAGGVTFASDIRVNNLTVGRGGGSVSGNAAFGIGALSANIDGGSNTAIGQSALLGTTGSSNNTAVGNDALRSTPTGSFGANTALGNQALRQLLSGSNNVAVGYAAGRYGGTGPFGSATLVEQNSDSVFIGSDSRPSNTGTTAEIVIGAYAVGLGSNTAVIGATTQSAAFIYGMLHSLGGISAAGATINGPLTGATATFSRLVTGNAGFSGALTGTATNASSLGGTAAASWAQLAAPNTFTALNTFNAGLTASAVYVSTGSTFAGLVTFTGGLSAAGTVTLASPNLTGTPTATTAAIGTNTTQIATTAFVQNEIVADTVTSVNGATGAITNVARTNLANTFSSQQIFTAGISAGGGVTADTMNVLGNLLVGATLTVSGNFVVNGTTTTINSTTISVDDKNIVLGDTISPAPSDTTADDGGITLRGTTDKTLVWKQTTAGGNVGSAWNSNQDFNLTSASGAYWVNGSQVLSRTSLGSSVTSSSLTSVGTITSGTWNSGIVYVDGGSY